MIRTPLDDATRDELQALRRKPLPPKVRDRVEMLLLSDAGWSAPRIAAHLGYCGIAPMADHPGWRCSRRGGRGTCTTCWGT